MHFSTTTLTLAALSASAYGQCSSTPSSTNLSTNSISAQISSGVNVHVVSVSSTSGALTFTPDTLTVPKGDMIQFQFYPKNHTVTQSNFDNPCEPISLHSNVTGVYSGFMPVAANAAEVPTYTIMVNDTKPMWLYCSQGKHCQGGMAMVVNQNTTANKSRSLTAYKAAAKNAKANLYPGQTPTEGETGAVAASGAATTMATATATDGAYGGAYGSAYGSATGAAAASAASASASGAAKTNDAGRAVGAGGFAQVAAVVGAMAIGFALVL
jgi:plastocyanin